VFYYTLQYRARIGIFATCKSKRPGIRGANLLVTGLKEGAFRCVPSRLAKNLFKFKIFLILI